MPVAANYPEASWQEKVNVNSEISYVNPDKLHCTTSLVTQSEEIVKDIAWEAVNVDATCNLV